MTTCCRRDGSNAMAMTALTSSSTSVSARAGAGYATSIRMGVLVKAIVAASTTGAIRADRDTWKGFRCKIPCCAWLHDAAAGRLHAASGRCLRAPPHASAAPSGPVQGLQYAVPCGTQRPATWSDTTGANGLGVAPVVISGKMRARTSALAADPACFVPCTHQRHHPQK
jgi:hypothetical protein